MKESAINVYFDQERTYELNQGTWPRLAQSYNNVGSKETVDLVDKCNHCFSHIVFVCYALSCGLELKEP